MSLADDQTELYVADVPQDLPSYDTIVKLCAAAGYNKNGISIEVAGNPRFWVKYGSGVTLGEARTQNQVAQIVNVDPESVVGVPEVYLFFLRGRCRYLVMEYVDGLTVESRQQTKGKYAEGDLEAVAAAFKQLTNLRVPADTSPGPVGSGPICHDFFLECKSTHVYNTVQELQNQINKLVAPQKLKVNFLSEIKNGLVLCPSDIDPSNFIIDTTGKVFAIDFGRTGYMPTSFVSYSLTTSTKPFTRRIARLVKYPESDNLRAMQVASGLLVISGQNSLGIDPQPPSGR
jgi:serine/threonine protein kinase